MKKRVLALVVVLAIVATLFASCTGSKVNADQTITIGTEAHGGKYNYMYSSSSYDRQVCDLVYQRLVISNDTGIPRPNDLIVKEFKSSDDGLEYFFTIKKGIKFADGKEMKASDIVFTYKTLADPSSTAYFLSSIYPLVDAEAYYKKESTEFKSVEAVDDYTVVFRFKEKLRTNISSAGVGILSESYYPTWEYGKTEEAMNEKMATPNGSGPYEVAEFNNNEFVKLTYRENFWAKKDTDYKINNVIIKFVNGDTEMDEIITKSVDVLPQILDKAYVDRVLNNEDGRDAASYIDLIQFKRSAYGYIGFNNQAGQTSDVALRQAIAYAFNRAQLVETLYGDLGRPIDVPMSQASSIFDYVEAGLTKYDFSYDKAREVLAAAGYSYDGATLLDPSGTPVKVKFLATTGNPVINAMVPVLADDMKEIGIEFVTESIQFAAMLPLIQNKDDNSFDMYFLASGWSSDEPDTWYSLFHSKNIAQTNSCRYNNPEFDQMLEEGRRYLDLTAQDAKDHYAEMARILNRDLPQLPIYANTITVMANKRVKNFHPSTFQEWHFALQGAYIEEIAE